MEHSKGQHRDAVLFIKLESLNFLRKLSSSSACELEVTSGRLLREFASLLPCDE